MNQENNNFNNGFGNQQPINNNVQPNQQPVNNTFTGQPNQNVYNQTQQFNQVNTSVQPLQPQYNQTTLMKPKKSKLALASLILGIFSILFCVFLNVLILAIPITGLILGVVSKNKKGLKIAGIILNSLAIVISIVVFVSILKSTDFKTYLSTLYNELEYSNSDNFIAGEYDCKGVDSDSDEYTVSLYLYEDNTFLYGKYGDLENNYAKGTYTYEDENKTNDSGEYKYFMVTFTGNKEDFIINGKESDHGFNSEMEIGITSKNVKKEGVIMFTNSYNMYYCYEK